MGFGKHLKKFLLDEEGQSTTEYILILSVVVMVAMKFKGVFGTKLMGILGNINTQMEQVTAPDGP